MAGKAQPAAAPAYVCEHPHVRDGEVAVRQEEYARLVGVSLNVHEAVRAAREEERSLQLQARADILSAVQENAGTTTAELKEALRDARAELKDREERLRELIKDRAADLRKLEEYMERALKAEHRDARALAEKDTELGKRNIDLAIAELNTKLWLAGMQHLKGTALGIAPYVMAGKANGAGAPGALAAPASSAGPVMGSVLPDESPPPLCFALCQLLWCLRDPLLVFELAELLKRFSTVSRLQPFGAQLMKASPEGFAAVMAALEAMPTEPPGGVAAGAATNGAPANPS